MEWNTVERAIKTAGLRQKSKPQHPHHVTAKEALEKKPKDDLMPFSGLKPMTAKYTRPVWQEEWDEAVIVSNKLN